MQSPPTLCRADDRCFIPPALRRDRICACSPPRSRPRPTPSRRCRPASPLQGERVPAARRASRRCAAHVHGAAVRRPPARAKADGFTLIEGSCFAASPAGTTNRHDYEIMRDEILGAAARPRCRSTACCSACTAPWSRTATTTSKATSSSACAPSSGPKCVIGVELDPHCHLTREARAARRHHRPLQGVPAHRRGRARRGRCSTSCCATLRGKIKPVMSLYDCRQIQSYPDHAAADARLRRPASRRMEGKDGILSISIVPLLPLCRRAGADRPRAGRRRWRQGQGRRAGAPSSARSSSPCAARPCREFFDVDGGVAAGARVQRRAGGAWPSPPTMPAAARPPTTPAILRQLIDRKVDDAALGPIWDPIAVRLCFDAGARRDVPAALRRQDRRRPPGSRSTPWSRSSASPRDCWQSFGPTKVPLGDCAAIRVGGDRGRC